MEKGRNKTKMENNRSRRKGRRMEGIREDGVRRG
jgi:hypothetical protein